MDKQVWLLEFINWIKDYDENSANYENDLEKPLNEIGNWKNLFLGIKNYF